MSIFVRKITKSKWPSEEILATNSDIAILPKLKADALTSCLRTSKDELSLWAIKDITDDELNKAILALITNSRLERIDTLQVVYFDEKTVNDLGIELKKSPGDTVISMYADLHQDMTQLTHEKLSKVCTLITSSIRDGRVKKFNERTLTSLLINAIKSNLVDQKKLHMALQHRLGLGVLDENGNKMKISTNGDFIPE